MRITTKAVYDIESGKLLEWEGFEYSGPMEMAGGGPSPEQKNAAASQARLTDQIGRTAQQNEDYTEAQRNKTTPFYTDLMTNGPSYFPAAMDYSSGINARAYAPAKAALVKRLGTSNGLPSGYRDQALTDFDEARAQGYDGSLMSLLADRQAAQERGAAGIMGEAQQANPLGYYSAAEGGNTSIMQAPLQRPGFAGTLGALIGAGGQIGAAYAGK